MRGGATIQRKWVAVRDDGTRYTERTVGARRKENRRRNKAARRARRHNRG